MVSKMPEKQRIAEGRVTKKQAARIVKRFAGVAKEPEPALQAALYNVAVETGQVGV